MSTDTLAELESRTYELGFHLDPELPQEEVKKAYQDLRGHIAALGTIVAEGEPTKIPLAYTISRADVGGRRDFTSAFFAWIAYEATAEAHAEVAAAAHADKNVFRFLDVRTTKDAATHAAEMHEIFAKSAAAQSSDADDGEIVEALEEEPKQD
jgi:ribosomal protein S6